jgi:hypothetical protein
MGTIFIRKAESGEANAGKLHQCVVDCFDAIFDAAIRIDVPIRIVVRSMCAAIDDEAAIGTAGAIDAYVTVVIAAPQGRLVSHAVSE